MREALKRLSAESLVYGLGQVGGRAVQLLLVPVLTRALTRDVYGVADLVLAYSQFAVLVLVAALHVAGALKHHFIDRNDVLRRMLPFGRPREGK